ncbi:MAG: helix-turn-helix domain-containing protein, partial [Planctomycetota bacterium]
LRQGRESIAHIAHHCGFDNLSHFYHRFRIQFGTSPARYRNSAPPSPV